MLPTDAKSGNPRYSARKAIAIWVIVSASIWVAIGAFFVGLFDQRGNSVDAEADRLSKITPAAGSAAPKP